MLTSKSDRIGLNAYKLCDFPAQNTFFLVLDGHPPPKYQNLPIYGN